MNREKLANELVRIAGLLSVNPKTRQARSKLVDLDDNENAWYSRVRSHLKNTMVGGNRMSNISVKKWDDDLIMVEAKFGEAWIAIEMSSDEMLVDLTMPEDRDPSSELKERGGFNRPDVTIRMIDKITKGK